MNAQTEQQINGIVDGFVNKGFSFTAFDVTKSVRASGTQVYHSECKDLVNGLFNNSGMPDYSRTSVPVPGAKVDPLVYHHQNANAHGYQPDWIVSNPNQNGFKHDGSVTAPPSGGGYTPLSQLDVDDVDADDGDDGDDDDGGVPTVPSVSPATNKPQSAAPLASWNIAVTKEGRLQIPINLARSNGLHPNLTVFLHYNGTVLGGKLEVKKYCASQGDHPVLVNKDGRIRVCKSILRSTIGVYPSYFVTDKNGEIEVRR